MVVAIAPFCTTDVTVDGGTGTATLQVGVANATTLFISATTPADIDANEFWVDTTPDPNGIALPAALKEIAITQDIQAEVVNGAGTQKVNAGVIRIDVWWMPLSNDGLVKAAA